MDVAFNQHAPHARKSNRSLTNLNHLSLAPLSSKLPLTDMDALPDLQRTSYLEGKSAPTTPSILSRSSSRVNIRKPALTLNSALAKSKSSANITRNPRSGAVTPRSRARFALVNYGNEPDSLLSNADRNDSDWLLRAGSLLASEARDQKGQGWLASRASSTSLTGHNDSDDDEMVERELAREREAESRRHSRRGSGSVSFSYGDADDEVSPLTTRLSFGPGSRPLSRFGSRQGSRRGSRSHLMTTPIEEGRERDSYFDIPEEYVAEPDFVDVDEDLYEAIAAKDEDLLVRRLAKRGHFGLAGFVEKLLGWSLFPVDEDGEDTETEGDATDRGNESEASTKSHSTRRSRQSLSSSEILGEEQVPPPAERSEGWQDAAWLLSVATKVLL